MHEGLLIRVVDTPINSLTHSSLTTLSLSLFLPCLLSLKSWWVGFIPLLIYFLTHRGPNLSKGEAPMVKDGKTEWRREEKERKMPSHVVSVNEIFKQDNKMFKKRRRRKKNSGPLMPVCVVKEERKLSIAHTYGKNSRQLFRLFALSFVNFHIL